MKRVALLFPGQGSQYVGMGKKLYDEFPAARQVFEEASEILGFSLDKLCFQGPMEELTRTENTQPALLASSVAAFRVYINEIGVTPLYSAGHSLGEITALTCAGAIRFDDAVRIVRKRGLIMQEAVSGDAGAMSAIIGINVSIVEECCSSYSSVNPDKVVVVSNINSMNQVVISGHKCTVDQVGSKLSSMGARVIPLKVSAPFHSPLMKPAADLFENELHKYRFEKLQWNVISNVTALPYGESSDIARNLSLHMVKPVRWLETMGYLNEQNLNLVCEVGPKTVLRELSREILPCVKAFSFGSPEDLRQLEEVLVQENQGTVMNKGNKAYFLARCLAHSVCTKNNNCNNDEYYEGVVTPYNEIQKMLSQIEDEGKDIPLEQIKVALDLLKTVFETKGVPEQEQRHRFEELLNETGIGY